jgi:serine/threonine protein kinase/Tol biopolymer transport system component
MIGQSISHYQILEKLGEGGMGVVYKAQDTKLNRFVALKFLPLHLSASEQDKARFIQEAQAAASLSHHNICTIHGIDEVAVDGSSQMFIVMEFVEGQTLRDKSVGRIGDSPPQIKQAIEIGIQLADGLAAAHEKGIVHRDLKPENIMIQRDGRVRIMDFGLAKLKGASRLTKAGSTVGTAGYMSPEQVQGLETDHRTDIFSLGVILYELLAGSSPFKGVHETAINYEIVNVDPEPISASKPDIDPALDGIVLECLAKEPGERYQSVAEVGKELRRYKRESSRSRVSRVTSTRQAYVPPGSSREMLTQPADLLPPTPSRVRKVLPWAIAAVGILIAAGATAFVYLSSAAPVAVLVTRSYIHPPAKTNFNTEDGGHMAISPDGETLAFVARDSSGKDLLWVRPLKSLVATALPGTDGSFYPFWSYDSRFIGYFVAGKMKKIDRAGGPSLTICDASSGRGASWNQDGVIVFSPGARTGLMRVAAAGGVPSWISRVDTTAGEGGHRWPHFLPDGNHFLYVTRTSPTGIAENDAIYVGSLSDSTMKKMVTRAASNMIYTNGQLIYLRQETLLAHPFDDSKMEFAGEAVPIAEQVAFVPIRSKGIFSVSRNGVLVYQSTTTAQRRMVWIDRTGREGKALGERAMAFQAQISRDGSRIAFDANDDQAENLDVWIYETARGVSTRFTFDKAFDGIPSWSPDGASIVFSSNRTGKIGLYRKNSSGTGEETLLREFEQPSYVVDWSLDGRYLLLLSVGGQRTRNDLIVLPLVGDTTIVPLLQSEFNESAGKLSPDLRWIAYQSDESGRFQVYVRPFLNADGTMSGSAAGKWQLSTNGGDSPLWNRNGKELFFVSGDRKLMSVEVKAKGSTFEVGSVQALFEVDLRGQTEMYDVTADGQMFLARVTAGGTSAPITLVMNWDEELQRMRPAR